MKLNLEEEELLKDLIDHELHKLVIKMVYVLAEDNAKRLLSCSLDTTTDRALVLDKARLEGARSLARSFEDYILKQRKKLLEPKEKA